MQTMWYINFSSHVNYVVVADGSLGSSPIVPFYRVALPQVTLVPSSPTASQQYLLCALSGSRTSWSAAQPWWLSVECIIQTTCNVCLECCCIQHLTIKLKLVHFALMQNSSTPNYFKLSNQFKTCRLFLIPIFMAPDLWVLCVSMLHLPNSFATNFTHADMSTRFIHYNRLHQLVFPVCWLMECFLHFLYP